jgi:biopolymer transport protein ExbD
MGMNIGSGQAGADAEPIMDINTTPLIDVMLVLLVMLIITIPIQLHNVNLNLPVGVPPPSEVKPEVVRIDIDERNVVYWNGEAVASRADWQARMGDVARHQNQAEVHIRPNKRSSYNTFAEVMVDANRAGLIKLGVVGAEQFMDDR